MEYLPYTSESITQNHDYKDFLKCLTKDTFIGSNLDIETKLEKIYWEKYDLLHNLPKYKKNKIKKLKKKLSYLEKMIGTHRI